MNIFSYITFAWLMAGLVIVSRSTLDNGEKVPTFVKVLAFALAIVVAPMVALSGMVKK